MSRRRILALAALVASSGCAGLGEKEFACPGLPGASRCQSAAAVYAAGDAAPAGAVEPAPAAAPEPAPEPAPAPAPLAPRPAEPLPLRTPAAVMRVWLAPWEDTRGDLHAPGYVYTEIEARRWQWGAPAPALAAVPVPLQMESREARAAGPPPARPESPRGARGEPAP